MKGILLLISFCLAFGKVYSQETIFFKSLKKPKKEILAYQLPISITCHFKDGTTRKLLLKKVVSDSFIFETYYNQTQNYSCKIQDIDKFKINKKGAALIYGGFWVSVFSSLYFFYFINTGNVDAKFGFLATPLGAISIIQSVNMYNSFPKVIRTNKFRIYVK
jgi:hypothetical protein